MITISKPVQTAFTLHANDLKDGEAYECETGEIYIGNSYDDIIAFSLYNEIIFHGCEKKFRKVHLHVTVTYE